MKTLKYLKEVFDFYKKEINATTNIPSVHLFGWIKTNRSNGSIGFIEFNDGTVFKNGQIVYNVDLSNFAEIEKLNIYTPIEVIGSTLATPNNQQSFDIIPTSIKQLSSVDLDYPLQKKRHGFEFLREIAHLRPRTNTFNALFRLRSELSFAINEFFHKNNFVYVHTPIITSNDAEGAGESFVVTTRDDGKYEEDFFSKKASLTVSGQIHVEPFALSFNKVYTFGPTFRAENSNTSRHASEFWMIEPEIAFADLAADRKVIEDMVKYCISYILKHCKDEMELFNKFYDTTLIERLKKVVSSKFRVMTYTEGIEHLLEAKKTHKFAYEDIHWGMDLQSEHERYLCEELINGPLFLIDYPKEIKAFYMKLNPDGKTVAACDLLVPRIGELVGGSQREDDYDKLLSIIKERKMDEKTLSWYLDLRRYGSVKHAGFGLGFERFLMYITAMENIRDVIPYPRTPGNLLF